MRVYVAGISGDVQYVKSLRTFYEIEVEPGDEKRERASGRGDVSRLLACEEFLERKEFGAIGFFDLDMLHPPDVLKRLRAHDLDMVTGHYYARNSRNTHSVISNFGDGTFPFPPMVDIPRSGLHEIAVTGLGCVLIKRRVVEDVARYLPKGDNPFAIGVLPQLTRDHRALGSDFRFFTAARYLGYKLWLDAGVESRHGIIYWVNHEIADRLRNYPKEFERLDAIEEQIRRERGVNTSTLQTRISKLEAQLATIKAQKEQVRKTLDFLDRQELALTAVLSEDRFLLQAENDAPDAPDALFPVTDTPGRMLENRTRVDGMSEPEAREARTDVLGREADGFVQDIQTLRSAK